MKKINQIKKNLGNETFLNTKIKMKTNLKYKTKMYFYQQKK